MIFHFDDQIVCVRSVMTVSHLMIRLCVCVCQDCDISF